MELGWCVVSRTFIMNTRSLVRSSPYAKIIYKYCHIFLALDLLLICLIVYGWYSVCDYRFCASLPTKKRLNILAFGDSMTKGFVKENLNYPYSKSLEKTLNRLHSIGVFFVVDNKGLNGDTAVGTAKTRLRGALGKKKYEWVIILLGTNDLRKLMFEKKNGYSVGTSSSSVDKIFTSLKELCETVIKYNGMLILGTITARQCEEDHFALPACDSFAKNRNLLNNKIRSYVANSSKMILLADFDRDLHYKSMSKEKRKEYWQDNVHLTETGYEVMAKLVYKTMQPFLPASVEQPNTRKNVTMKH